MPRSAANLLDSYLSKPLWWRRGRAPTLKAMMRWFRPWSGKQSRRTAAFVAWKHRIDEQRAKYIAFLIRVERHARLLLLGLLPIVVEDQTLNRQIALTDMPIEPNAPSA